MRSLFFWVRWSDDGVRRHVASASSFFVADHRERPCSTYMGYPLTWWSFHPGQCRACLPSSVHLSSCELVPAFSYLNQQITRPPMNVLSRQLGVFKEVVGRACKRAVAELMLEFDTGGNVRFEEGRPGDVWFSSCADLVKSRVVSWKAALWVNAGACL